MIMSYSVIGCVCFSDLRKVCLVWICKCPQILQMCSIFSLWALLVSHCRKKIIIETWACEKECWFPLADTGVQWPRSTRRLHLGLSRLPIKFPGRQLFLFDGLLKTAVWRNTPLSMFVKPALVFKS